MFGIGDGDDIQRFMHKLENILRLSSPPLARHDKCVKRSIHSEVGDFLTELLQMPEPHFAVLHMERVHAHIDMHCS